ncbi:MAG TPA: class I SAM-dependent methyltransferase [Terriglobales bacterium]
MQRSEASDSTATRPLTGNAPGLIAAVVRWWRDERRAASWRVTSRRLMGIGWEFVRDSFPDRKRQRYGDAEFDWNHRVNTTSGGVGWRARLIGLLNSAYQPMEPELFCEMLNGLGINYADFTFVDIGSGKGRALLMASEYPFRRILGIELLPELNQIARENIAKFVGPEQRCQQVEAVCGDATAFQFPAGPLVVYLFHPLPESGFLQVMNNLQRSWREQPRAVHVVYANPVFEAILASRPCFRKSAGTHQYSRFELRDGE